MKNNPTLEAMEKRIEELAEENKLLKSKIKEIHINDAFLQQDFKNITPSFVYKIWRIFRFLRNIVQ